MKKSKLSNFSDKHEMGKDCCGGSDAETTAPVVENVSEAEVKDVLARIKQNPAQAQSLIQSIDIEGNF